MTDANEPREMVWIELVRESNLSSWEICVLTFGIASHARLVVPKGMRIQNAKGSLTLDREMCIESHVVPGINVDGSAVKSGVALRECLPKELDFTFRLRLGMEVSAFQAAAIYGFAASQIGKPYDWPGLVGFYLQNVPRDWRDPVSWFCSELVAASFERAGIYLLSRLTEVWGVTPDNLRHADAFTQAVYWWAKEKTPVGMWKPLPDGCILTRKGIVCPA